MANTLTSIFSHASGKNLFLCIVITLIVAAIWGLITQSVVNKRGSDENWFWWGFFFGPIACAIASLTFKPLSEYEKAKLILTYKELFDEGFISEQEFEKKIQILSLSLKRPLKKSETEK